MGEKKKTKKYELISGNGYGDNVIRKIIINNKVVLKAKRGDVITESKIPKEAIKKLKSKNIIKEVK